MRSSDWCVGGDAADAAVEFRRGALVEGREAQRRILAELQLIDIGRRDLDLDAERVAIGHDQQDRFPGRDDAADGVDGELMHAAGLRGADVDALQLVLGGDLAFDQFADLGLDLAQVLADLAAQVAVDLQDLQLGLRDLAFGLRDRC